MILSATRINPIGGALTQECESNVSGRAGVFRGAQPGLDIEPNQTNNEGVSGFQAGSLFNATSNSHEAQGVSQYNWEAQGSYVVDGAINTRLLGTEVLGSLSGKGGPGAIKIRCALCRKKKWIIDSEVESFAELNRFRKCMACVTSIKEERARKALENKIEEQWDDQSALVVGKREPKPKKYNIITGGGDDSPQSQLYSSPRGPKKLVPR